MGILDEAAATAETYIPLILRLQVENLVLLVFVLVWMNLVPESVERPWFAVCCLLFSLLRLLGDHKQLSPLVLASGGDREIKDKSLGRSPRRRCDAATRRA